MARWPSNNQYVNIDLNVSNIYLSGDWPNMFFHFDCNFNYYCNSGYANMDYNNVNFHTQVTGYETETKTANVNFSIVGGQESPRYGANYYNPGMGNSRQRTVDVHAWISNGMFTGGGWTKVTSPKVEDPTNLSMSISNVSENSCVVTHSFTNKRNYWYVRLYDRNTETYYNLNGNTGSGTTTITGLQPNTEYKFELWACGRDGAWFYGSNPAQTIKTLGKSSVGNQPTYTVGTSFPLLINGYSDSFTHTALFQIGTYQFSRTNLKRGTITITPSAAENTKIYEQMNTITSKSMSITLTTYVNGTSIGANSGSGNVQVDQTVCKPSVTSFAYQDTNTLSIGLTGNNQYILQNVSKLQIYNIVATAKNAATLSRYLVDVSGQTYSSNTTTIDAGVVTQETQMSVKALDSRGLQGVKTVSFTKFIPYHDVIVSEFIVTRKNLVEQSCTLKLSASFSLISVNNVNKNAMQSIKYRYKETTSSTWGAYTTLACTISGATITYHNVIGNFSVDKSYHFELVLTDKVKSVTVQTTLVVGKPTLSLRKSSVGINKVPVSGRALDVEGSIYANAATIPTINSSIMNAGNIELSSSTPFIDFHAGSSTADYTSRLIARTANMLTCTHNFNVEGQLRQGGTEINTLIADAVNAQPQKVTVSGWNEGWKFPSGLMILRYWEAPAITWSAWGSVYSKDFSPRNIPAGTFVDNPSFYMGVGSAANSGIAYWTAMNGRGTVTQSPQMTVIRPTNYGSSVSYSIMAVGRWK